MDNSMPAAKVDESTTSSSDEKQERQKGKKPARGQKRRKENQEEEERKAERRAANRRSAYQSRQRRKILIEDLQRSVASLTADNNSVRAQNEELKSQLEVVRAENVQLRIQQQQQQQPIGYGSSSPSSSYSQPNPVALSNLASTLLQRLSPMASTNQSVQGTSAAAGGNTSGDQNPGLATIDPLVLAGIASVLAANSSAYQQASTAFDREAGSSDVHQQAEGQGSSGQGIMDSSGMAAVASSVQTQDPQSLLNDHVQRGMNSGMINFDQSNIVLAWQNLLGARGFGQRIAGEAGQTGDSRGSTEGATFSSNTSSSQQRGDGNDRLSSTTSSSQQRGDGNDSSNQE